ncbi:MAG: hypothetical protein Q6373_000980 [Candidatus Sigynarchaeota archaeon]
MNDVSPEQRLCSVKNCQKVLEPGDQVTIGGQIFCKPCAVCYFKDMLGADLRDD